MTSRQANDVAITNKNTQVKEIVKCGKDPLYFINKYCKIQHPVKGLIPFETYNFQDDCIGDFHKHRLNIVLKARQLGLSTITAAYAAWLALFHRDQQILVIATKRLTAVNFIKKVKILIRHIPKWLILSSMTANNTQGVEFASGSSIKAIPTSDDAGRSEGLSLLIIDEAAFIRNFDELWAGLYPTLSAGGKAIILSTPNGVGGQYHRLYTEAEAKLNKFNHIKLPWYVHPDHNEEWFANECKQLSKAKIAQEHLCDFVASGDTFLSQEDIEWISNVIKDPIERWGYDRNIWVWSYPIKEHKYIISADVARGDAKDYSAFHVIDTTANEIAAEYKGKVHPDKFGEMLHEIGLKYETALVCPENNSFGFATISRLQDLGYPKLYYQNSKAAYIINYMPSNTNQVAGFNTNGRTRVQILAKLEEVIRNKRLKIYSSRFYHELKTFVWAGMKPQAMKNHHDDLVISLAIGTWLYDASGEYSKDAQIINKNMVNAMSKESHNFSHVKNNGHDMQTFNPFQAILTSAGQQAKPPTTKDEYLEYDWLLK